MSCCVYEGKGVPSAKNPPRSELFPLSSWIPQTKIHPSATRTRKVTAPSSIIAAIASTRCSSCGMPRSLTGTSRKQKRDARISRRNCSTGRHSMPRSSRTFPQSGRGADEVGTAIASVWNACRLPWNRNVPCHIGPPWCRPVGVERIGIEAISWDMSSAPWRTKGCASFVAWPVMVN